MAEQYKQREEGYIMCVSRTSVSRDRVDEKINKEMLFDLKGIFVIVGLFIICWLRNIFFLA